MDGAIVADRGLRGDMDMTDQLAVPADHHMRADHAEGADRGALADHGAVFHACGRIDHAHRKVYPSLPGFRLIFRWLACGPDTVQ